MNLFAKIYGVGLILFLAVMAFIILHMSARRIAETEHLLLEREQTEAELVTSEIQRWHSVGKWPFETLRSIAGHDHFLFWWIVDKDNVIYLADQVEFVGTNAGAYFPEIREQLSSVERTNNIVLNRAQHYGVFKKAFAVGNERWAFWHGFSTAGIEEARGRIIQAAIFYSGIGLTVLGAVLFLVIRHFLRPLNALALGVRKFGEGNLDYRIRKETPDEIGLVSSAFNKMAESLQTDIDRRIRAEEALKESEELYRSLVENINMGITLIDENHNIVMANSAQGRMLRKPVAEFKGRKCFQEFEKRDHVCEHCPGVEAMKTGTPKETIASGRRDDGSTLTVNIKAFPVYSEHGTQKGFIEVVEDISQQIKTQEDLAAEKERLAVTLRSIGDGVITTDISGNITLLNKVAEKLTGWRPEEAMGRPLEDVFSIINELTREACENPAKKVLTSGQIVGLANHTILVARDGTERSIADSGAPILDAQSNIIGVVLVFRDVTEQLRTEKELLKVKKLESIGVLAGGIAHDFNNILAAILGNLSLALIDDDLKEDTRKTLSDAERASLRAKELTQQLLTFAKGGEPVRKTASLAEVITESASFVLHGEKVACRFDIPEDLWLVDIDKGQISQVIQNIVINASHAMPGGGTISISCENLPSVSKGDIPYARKGRYVRIRIQDTGIGMPANIVEKIFDPYFTTKHQGSGLGLAITQSIISKHDGHIRVDSTPGLGTTFTIYLPASEKMAEARKEIPELEQASLHGRILLMDDEQMVRDVARKMLVTMGCDVVLSENGEEAIALYQEAMNSENRFDLVVMDLTVPGGMGGKEAVKEILALDPEARVIVSSGYSNDPILAHYSDHGFCGVIVKPYRYKDVERVTSEHLDGK